MIGVEGYNLSTGRMTELFLKRYGLERERDYDLVVAGNSAERYAALVNGKRVGCPADRSGSFLLVDQGFSNLGALEDALPRMEFEGWTVNADTARQAPDALVASVVYGEDVSGLDHPHPRRSCWALTARSTSSSRRSPSRPTRPTCRGRCGTRTGGSTARRCRC